MDDFRRNRWTICSGIHGRFPPDYAEPEKPIFGSTDITSGSAVVPEYNPSIYKSLYLYNEIYKSDPDEKQKFNNEIRKFFIEQMKKESKMDMETYLTQKRYGRWIYATASIMVTVGIVFSIVQLINAINYGNFSQFDTTLEIQKAGNFIITTSSIGALVLILSLVFFLLFLQFVYKPNSKRRNFLENIKDVRPLMDNKDQ